MTVWDVVVVGGGTSGLMAACAAAQAGARVLILEKNNRLGRKLLLTGGTRCNVTNNRPAADIIAHIPGNGKFLYGAFHQFDNQDIMAFFTERGVALKEEDHGRMFPVSNQAKTILETFERELTRLGVTVWTEKTVSAICVDDQQRITGVRTTAGDAVRTQSLILAVGGKSVPKTGSTGDGYAWLRQLGHTITPLFATEVPLTSSEPFIRQKTLQGLSLRDVALSVVNASGRTVVRHQMDMIFTHFGISGPAVLRCSSFAHAVRMQAADRCATVVLDAVPQQSVADLQQLFEQDQSHKAIKNVLKQFVPERYAQFLLERAGVAEQWPIARLSSKERQEVVRLLKHFSFTVDGSLPIEKGFVTGGGVKTSEINPKTMASKLISGLFFSGELIDIHGYTGGYNITAAFVTGHVAGQHAAFAASETP